MQWLWFAQHSTSAGGWATMTPHLTGTKLCLPRFLYILTCKSQLWGYTQNVTITLGMQPVAIKEADI